MKKYKVTKEFMEELVEWRDEQEVNAETGAPYAFVADRNIQDIPEVIGVWWTGLDDPIENNNRLIAIIQWLNGKDVFEVTETKYIVRSDKTDRNGDYTYVYVSEGLTVTYHVSTLATKFDTREEALEWANSHQAVIEVDEEGKEI